VLASEEGESALSIEKVNEDRQITLHDRESRKCINDHIIPMLEAGITPVICGFLARDPMGKLTTLGRGGSDTTAFFIGKLLSADEVIIVTDTEGVLTADPEKVETAGKISVISTDQLDTMARGGALVLHPHSLEHKTPDMRARVVNFKSDELTEGGTLIEGFLRATLRSTPFPLALISVVGEEAIEDASLISHLARSTISSPKFQDQPGILAHIAKMLAENEINVIDLITLQGDVAVYVDWNDREDTTRLLRRLAVSARLDEVIAGR
jgi:aspartate kinase